MTEAANSWRDRRALGRALSRAADRTSAEILAEWEPHDGGSARRIAFTGSPGAGKSSLVGELALLRLKTDQKVGVIAIDPSSPYSGGAILGDRFRMDKIAEDPRLYIRSLASRGGTEGLTDNLGDILGIMDSFGFDEVLLETVGVGQTDHAVRNLVDTVVVVLMPNAGDSLQAMKSGLNEAADIFVVNKADLPGADSMVADLRSVLDKRSGSDWRTPILTTSVRRSSGIDDLSDWIDRHMAWRLAHLDQTDIRRQRLRYQAQSLLQRMVADIMKNETDDLLERPLRDLMRQVAAQLAAATED